MRRTRLAGAACLVLTVSMLVTACGGGGGGGGSSTTSAETTGGTTGGTTAGTTGGTTSGTTSTGICQANDYQCVQTRDSPITMALRTDTFNVYHRNGSSVCGITASTRYTAYDSAQPLTANQRVGSLDPGGAYVEQARLLEVSQYPEYRDTLPVVSPWDGSVTLHLPNSCAFISGNAADYSAILSDLDGLTIECNGSSCSASDLQVGVTRVDKSVLDAPRPNQTYAGGYRHSPAELLLISTPDAVVVVSSTLLTETDVSSIEISGFDPNNFDPNNIDPGLIASWADYTLPALSSGYRTGYLLAVVRYSGLCGYYGTVGQSCGSTSFITHPVYANVTSTGVVQVRSLSFNGTDYFAPTTVIVKTGEERAGSVLGGNVTGLWDLYPTPYQLLTHNYALSREQSGSYVQETSYDDVITTAPTESYGVTAVLNELPGWMYPTITTQLNGQEMTGMGQPFLSINVSIHGDAVGKDIALVGCNPACIYDSYFSGTVSVNYEAILFPSEERPAIFL